MSFTALLGAVIFAKLGSQSLPIIAAVSGLADAHAVIPSLGALITQHKLTANQALLPILISFTVNAGSKSLIAFQVGGAKFGMQMLTSLCVMTAGVWLGFSLLD
ncbi:MAG: DUF4010 domain-containing protein [Cytophagales bacterium]|nr:DUF4010 domain-containing protein [Cytophagales bacterium]